MVGRWTKKYVDGVKLELKARLDDFSSHEEKSAYIKTRLRELSTSSPQDSQAEKLLLGINLLNLHLFVPCLSDREINDTIDTCFSILALQGLSPVAHDWPISMVKFI